MTTQTIHVLLVDDEADFSTTLAKRLNKRGLLVQTVAGGEQALAVMNSSPVDVVVLDIRMPGMDGLETLEHMKSRFPLVEIILLTGHASLEAAANGMEHGAFDYLIKPIEIDALHYMIEDAFEQKKLQDHKIRSIDQLLK
jgi:DNA-binding NtrC family response regulator